ncbi:MAG TPA: bifunctional hydroxymethylpyrimidine kinase/phosphomethylpyrimidine kinase [Candidatus Dormibacteraeota bacterium]|nr:bifunctional hydroxymethylpyrimidine kinase/phosphomethylpyrimidine kinase [Candidatus Dormibacteraeota bacterium]
MLESQVQVLAIGMSEPAGASGVEADLVAIAAAGGRGTAVVTAMAVEAGGASRLITPIGGKDLRALMRGAEARELAAIKLGMLPSDHLVSAAADELRDGARPLVVADPVLGAPGFRAGERLLQAYCNELLPLVDAVTADLQEATALVGEPLDRHGLIRALVEMGARWVVLKGEAQAGGEIEDLISDGQRWFQVRSEPAEVPLEGADAAFASTLAVLMARGESVAQAAGQARHRLLERARRAAPAGARP